ncbi:MAG: hypothetical protein ACOX3W_09075 [Christensenellaceae bacterium]|jgi:hypothetical protein
MKKNRKMGYIFVMVCLLIITGCNGSNIGEINPSEANSSENSPSISIMPSTSEAPSEEIEIDPNREILENGEWLDDFPVTEEEVLDPKNMREYSLEELVAFFGVQSLSFYEFSFTEEDPIGFEKREIHFMNEVFPIENIRYLPTIIEANGKTYEYPSHYTLYKVKEGGYYIVWWNHIEEEQQRGIVQSGGLYLKSDMEEENFSSIDVGNMLWDVFQIDPYLRFREIYTARIKTVSLLDCNKAMVITYENTFDEYEEDENIPKGLWQALRVIEKEIVDVSGIEDYREFVTRILPQDFEMCISA